MLKRQSDQLSSSPSKGTGRERRGKNDGVAIEGIQEGGEAEVVSRLSDSVTRACGYTAGVTVERVG